MEGSHEKMLGEAKDLTTKLTILSQSQSELPKKWFDITHLVTNGLQFPFPLKFEDFGFFSYLIFNDNL